MRDNERLITIERYERAVDAELAKMVLDRENIPCYLAGVGLSVTVGYPAVTSVELQVFERDAERAVEILNEMTPLDEGDEDFDDEEFDEEEDVG